MKETVELTNMCMVCDNDGNVLVQFHKKDWIGITFPGGHVEDGEDFEQAVIREIQEETGLTIIDPIVMGIMDWYDPIRHHRHLAILYKANKYEGTLLHDGIEGDVYWTKLQTLDKEPNLSADFIPILNIMKGMKRGVSKHIVRDGVWTLLD